MMEKIKTIVIIILFLTTLILSGICLYLSRHQVPPEVIQITLRDTIFIPKDSIVEKVRWKTKFDTIIEFQYKDSVIIHDTIQIPIEHKQATVKTSKDSLLDIEANILYHGFKADIDSVEFLYNFHYTEKLPNPEKKIGIVWNIGFYAGYGVNFNNGQYYFSPEVGIGGSIGIGGKINRKR